MSAARSRHQSGAANVSLSPKWIIFLTRNGFLFSFSIINATWKTWCLPLTMRLHWLDERLPIGLTGILAAVWKVMAKSTDRSVHPSFCSKLHWPRVALDLWLAITVNAPQGGEKERRLKMRGGEKVARRIRERKVKSPRYNRKLTQKGLHSKNRRLSEIGMM